MANNTKRYYCVKYSDILANGIPECCAQKHTDNLRFNNWPDVGSELCAVLKCLATMDESSTFLAGYSSLTKAEAKTIMNSAEWFRSDASPGPTKAEQGLA